MTITEARSAVATALAGIAPEIDLTTLDPQGRLRDEVDLDSLDFLNIVEALHDLTGVDIPEADYGRVETLNGMLAYLVDHSVAAVPEAHR